MKVIQRTDQHWAAIALPEYIRRARFLLPSYEDLRSPSSKTHVATCVARLAVPHVQIPEGSPWRGA
jgi:hypothetical protein